MALLLGIKKLFNSRLPDSPIRGVDDSPTHRVGESILNYEYLHEFEAKIETARKQVLRFYVDCLCPPTYYTLHIKLEP